MCYAFMKTSPSDDLSLAWTSTGSLLSAVSSVLDGFDVRLLPASSSVHFLLSCGPSESLHYFLFVLQNLLFRGTHHATIWLPVRLLSGGTDTGPNANIVSLCVSPLCLSGDQPSVTLWTAVLHSFPFVSEIWCTEWERSMSVYSANLMYWMREGHVCLQCKSATF